MNYKITIEYDGTRYHGWQRQEDGMPTIQSEIETAIEKFTGQKVELIGSGRTDSGVHAYGQVAHFKTEKEYDDETVKMALNNYLRDCPISIRHAERVSDDFHARFDARQRYYEYKILNRREKPALDLDKVWWVPFELDVKKMHEAGKFLIGKHDFTSFRASECQAKSPIKTVDSVEVTQSGDIISIKVSARSFLHHQIRNIAGTLVEVGKGKKDPSWIKEVLDAKNRSSAGATAPASGLYFVKVEYEID